MINPKTDEWRAGADKLLESLARENKFVVADMLIIYLEASGYGLADYSPVGGVFKRAAKRGILRRIARPTRQALWLSQTYAASNATNTMPVLEKGQIVGFRNFGEIDKSTYRIAEVVGDCLRLEKHS